MRYILVFIAVLFMSNSATAQLSISLNFNADTQPIWGPTGYDYVEYYYLPDIEVYYYVPQRRFYHFERGRWISSSSLPSRHRGYDLYNSYKVVVNDRTPYRNHAVYRDRYVSYKGHRGQSPIRDSRDSKYFSNKKHPEHNKWIKQQKNNNSGNNKGNNKERDKKRGRD